MAEAAHPNIFSIPGHRAFADALVAGLIDLAGGDAMALARGLVLVPSNRAGRAITEAFVRHAGGGGVLLPRLVAVGDLELGERVGLALDGAGLDLPPAIEGCARTLILARLVRRMRQAQGDAVPVGEAVRLAGQLARTLDQLLVEEVDPARLATLVPEGLAHHWEDTLSLLRIVVEIWPALLDERGASDAATRRNRLFDALAAAWQAQPPAGFVVAAGIANASPALARLLRTVAWLPCGMVVLPGLDRAMPPDEWDSLGPDCAEAALPSACETHPQFQLKLMLDRMSIHRDEVTPWRRAGGFDGPPARARAVQRAMAPAAFTGRWEKLAARERRLTGVRFVETATPAEEAQAIALEMRHTLDTPGRTAALVTPDRQLARRVAAHLGRWGIRVDDSGGRPLSRTPEGALLLTLAETAAEGFAPVPLLALLKHPLVEQGEGRAAWLGAVRALDKALRGPRPAPGLDGVARRLRELADDRWLSAREKAALPGWWDGVSGRLRPLGALFVARESPFADLLEQLRRAAESLAGDAVWRGPAGRAAAELFDDLSRHEAEVGPLDPAELPGLLAGFMDEVAVRPAYGGHPRLAIYGLLEARLQRADLMILGGLNEGTWPATPAPDPWLAPKLRAELGLPGLDRRIGLAAHDLVQAMGAPQVLVTRARRDMSAPTVASRLWLRLQAMTGGVPRQPALAGWAAAIDRPDMVTPAERPAPAPPAGLRPKKISVTAVDRLRADPYAFYASAMLGLRRADGVDADPSAAERGNAVHDILEAWIAHDGGEPAALVARAEDMIAQWSEHPLLRRLWGPRVLRAVLWAADALAADRAGGWTPAAWEARGEAELGGILLTGRADRIDRRGAELAVIDYKTGRAPSYRQVEAGFALQLGLLGWLAERGAVEGVEGGSATRFEYWRLPGGLKTPGERKDPRKFRTSIDPALDDLAGFAARHFIAAAEEYLNGDKPFVAKLHPEYAIGDDFDHLARVEEWLGRGRG
jgi:ATP-dependent helicase/nuclease subunit B